MKKLLILMTILVSQSIFARTTTFYPKFNGKTTKKLCYNASTDNFTYTKKTIFGNVKTKTVSRVDKEIGDCLEYKYTRTGFNSRGDRDRMVRTCVRRAKEVILYPLTVKAKVYEMGQTCKDKRRGEDRCYPTSTFLYSFDYDIKDCL